MKLRGSRFIKSEDFAPRGRRTAGVRGVRGLTPLHCLLLQSVDAYILKPKLFSSALGVSGVSILISTIVLGNMFGILGVLVLREGPLQEI